MIRPEIPARHISAQEVPARCRRVACHRRCTGRLLPRGRASAEWWLRRSRRLLRSVRVLDYWVANGDAKEDG